MQVLEAGTVPMQEAVIVSLKLPAGGGGWGALAGSVGARDS